MTPQPRRPKQKMLHPYTKPMSYSARKLRGSMRCTASAIRSLREAGPQMLDASDATGSLVLAFHEQLEAWVYLHGYGAELFPLWQDEQRLVARLLSMEFDEFEDLLGRLEGEGVLNMDGYTD